MFYHLFDYINELFNPPGFDIFRFLSFRSILSAVTGLFLSFYLGPKIIGYLNKKQIGETIKEEGPKSHQSKAGTPTMGGIIVILSITISTLLWADLKSSYIILVLVGTIFLAIVGYVDDYMKVVKKYPKGLIARYKLLGQVIVGLVVGLSVYYLPEFSSFSTQTTLPFFKNLNFDFSYAYIPAVIFIITATSNAVNSGQLLRSGNH